RELGLQVPLPDDLTVIELRAGQFSFGAQRVAAVFGQQRCAPWTVVVAVRIAEPAGVRLRPERLPACGAEALDDLVAGGTVMQHQPIAPHRRSAVAGADIDLPDQWRSVC